MSGWQAHSGFSKIRISSPPNDSTPLAYVGNVEYTLGEHCVDTGSTPDGQQWGNSGCTLDGSSGMLPFFFQHCAFINEGSQIFMSSWIKTAIERLMKLSRKYTSTSTMKDVVRPFLSFCLDSLHLLLSQVLCMTIAMAHVCHILLNILVVVSGEVIIVNRQSNTDTSWCILLVALDTLENGRERSRLQCRGWKCCKSILKLGNF